jgi:hypothetical protein
MATLPTTPGVVTINDEGALALARPRPGWGAEGQYREH